MVLLVFYIALLCGISAVTESAYTSIIQTDKGPVRGKILTTVRQKIQYSAFLGIPYGEPPIGYLRFKPPVEKNNWSNVLDATKVGNYCIHYSSSESRIKGSEDCLFVNIFTPHTRFTNFNKSDLKAVLVWIHGGGFIEGQPDPEETGPDFIIEDDVIVVTMSYRLGSFGFLNLQHKNVTGNAGLKDQNLALKWVNKNIERFGGDPNRITLIGQSAGAVAVDLHVISDMSSGLFNQSIAMSGSPLCLYWGTQSVAEALFRGFTLASNLGIDAPNKDRLLQGLYAASAEDIAIKSSEMILFPFRPTFESPFIATNEKKFLTRCAVDKYQSGRYNKGPHMTGFTSLEGKFFSQLDTAELMKERDKLLNDAAKSDPALRRLLKSVDLSQLLNQNGRDLAEWFSDLFFITGIDSKQQMMQKRNKYPIYYYRFSFEDKKSFDENKNNVTGVGHGEDIKYLFYDSNLTRIYDDPKVQDITRKYVRLITNFAKYGNPTSNDKDNILQGVTWPESGKLGLHLEIDTNLTVGSRPINDRVKSNEAAGIGSSRLIHHCF